MNTLVYLSFGKGQYTNELVHAVLSALDASSRRGDMQVVAYTDDPAAMSGLSIRVEPLSPERLAEWAGPFNFLYRPKVLAIRHALETFGGRVIYCDADTYLLGRAEQLFDRVAPGASLMYAEEGSPRGLGISELSTLLREHRFTMCDGRRWDISPDTMISNAGVVGLHERDLPLVDEALHLLDQICHHTGYFGVEQFAVSASLSLHTRLRHAADLVHHYWHPMYREAFNATLSRILEDQTLGSYEARYLHVKRVREHILNRPETIRRRVYAKLWAAANKTGVLKRLTRHHRMAGIGPS